MSEQATRARASRTLPFALLALLAACGPSQREQPETNQEVERRSAIAEAEQALSAFAQRHDATPTDLPLEFSLSQPFTAQLQQDLEGSIVAFRAGLIDIVRTAENSYELVLGMPLFPTLTGTVATMAAPSPVVADLLATPPDLFSSLLVAAKVESVVPLTLRLQSCAEADCTEVELEPNLTSRVRRVRGRVIAVEREPKRG